MLSYGIEVLLGLRRIRLHRLAARLPVGGAHLAVLLHKLERLHEAESLVHIATNWEVIDGDLPQVLLRVDDEKAAVRHTVLLLQHAVRLHDGLGLVGKNGNVHLAEPTLFALKVCPGQVGVLAVHRAGKHLAPNVVELLHAVGELADLGGADKGEIQWIEEKHQPLPCRSEVHF
ncbi:Tryparedoxin peroxidase [Trypanosoma rangeli SC58]|uniref:Tryparedoxin peroxidase n=1 Tax=Trypanosoma rangeli SC58 TaxID=429131 RepID=A0A061IUC5_TRYRA|nr:Tryparedoxin peroxidase [Trypanosoma rangeli SC58]